MKHTLARLIAVPSLILAGAITFVAPAHAAEPGTTTTPSALLDGLRVAVPSSVDYNRDLFAEGIDADGDGCNTRREVLQTESLVPVTISSGCTITAGEWFSWYEGVTQTDPAQLEMDHLVALKEAWISGAHAWTDQQRSDYANDLDIDETLTMVTGSMNSAKSAYDPAQWIPSYEPSRCEYASDWIVVKYRWNLSIDSAEHSALQNLIDSYCGDKQIVVPAVRTDTASPAEPSGGVNPLPAGTHRLAGADRFGTAVAISSRFNPGVPVVYIATAYNYPDALSASALAGAQGGPLLLVEPNGIPAVVRTELTRLAPQQIIIAGGTAAVSESVATQLRQLAPVSRAAGADRFATSQLLAEMADLGGTTAFAATGFNFPDALSASAAAGTLNGPVVLVNGAAGSVDAGTIGTLDTLGISTVRIAGGPNAVSTGVESSLSATRSVYRHYGADRYETGVEVNRSVFADANTVYLAVGTGFADALAGGALAAATDSPLFIVQGGCIPPVVKNQINAYGPSSVVLLGGEAVLGPAVASLTECAPPPVNPGPGTPTTPSNPGNSVNCGDFGTWRSAQDWFERYYPHYGDVAELDADDDLIACESLPGAP